jgi:hypothetical protein
LPGNLLDPGTSLTKALRVVTLPVGVSAYRFRPTSLSLATAGCKNGARQNAVRSDFTPFRNQGAVCEHVSTGT